MFLSSYPFFSRAACAGAMLFAVSSLTTPALAQRLPQGVRPEHYSLSLTPDLKAATFTGDEVIDLVLSAPAKSITLNAAEITFQSVNALPASATTPPPGFSADITLDKAKEQATFSFPQELPAGKVKLVIKYTGILNGQLRGFYLSKTAKRNYAVTQFESTDARRAFPSFDEPAFKATFDVALTVDAADTAISNTNIVADTPAGPGKHTLRFATTPKMSTYLVAFLVGDFTCVSGSSDGVPIRACATPDKVQMGKFAVSAAEFVLHYYNNYFGIKYPMPKLDMIALPDFEAGAMENFGAITYRETDFLIDEKTASLAAKKRVAIVVAHEMAHQWFGDMVTMQWWDNIWLNEGFATWMESKPVAAWKPEWHFSQDDAVTLDGTLNLDSLATTRTIRAKADTPSEINEMFDGISYGKAGAVLSMVENYLGQETFRQGVHNYLAAHLYANATAEDFWNAQTVNSKKPVDKIMSSFVVQPGVPLLSFTRSGAGKVEVAQRRFFLSPMGKAAENQVWIMPVCFKAGVKSSCELLNAAQQSLSVPAAARFVYGDAGGKGYYRSKYTADAYRKIVAQVETSMTPEERILLLGDRWSLMRSGEGKVGDYLDLVAAVRQDKSSIVLRAAVGKIASIDARIATSEERKQLAAWVRTEFEPVYKALGPASPADTQDKKQLRAVLFGVLGEAKDASVIAEARQLTEKYLADQSSVEPALAQSAMEIAAVNGDVVLYDKLLALSKSSGDPSVQTTALFRLANFTEPALVTRTLDYVVSGQVRNQDSWILIAVLLGTRDTRDQAWQYIQQNWSKVQAQFTTSSGGRVVAAAGNFCSPQRHDEVLSFFNTHKVMAADRALRIAGDNINDCVQLRSAQEPNLKEWLDQQKMTAVGAQ